MRKQGLDPLLPVIDDDSQHRAYRVMMFCIGAVVRRGDRNQKATLLAVLRQHIVKSDYAGSIRTQIDDTIKRESAREYSSKVEQFLDNETSSAVDIGRFATALHEYSAQHSIKPIYRVIQLSIDPPRFQAFVAVAGDTYEGFAKTKRQARQEAAKRACLKRNIRPDEEGLT